MSLGQRQDEQAPPRPAARRNKLRPRRILICDPAEIRDQIRRRRETGADRFDEVWDDTYVMSPNPNNLHQLLVLRLAVAIDSSLSGREGVQILPGVNVSDRPEDWLRNFRVPDLSVFFPGNPAEDRDTHWLGGPDVAVEIISPRDQSRNKLGFYAKVGVRELLLVERKPWRLEFYRLEAGSLAMTASTDVERATPVVSDLLGLSFRLVADKPRPKIEIACPATGQTWLA